MTNTSSDLKKVAAVLLLYTDGSFNLMANVTAGNQNVTYAFEKIFLSGEWERQYNARKVAFRAIRTSCSDIVGEDSDETVD